MFAEPLLLAKPKPQQQVATKPKQQLPRWVFRPTLPFDKFYVLDQVIGGGSYGKVHICHPINEATINYAVKVISKRHFSHDLDLFRSEITIMRMLHHQNLIQFIDCYENESFLYIVMEYNHITN
jgi:serine/threonine protein kinase